MRQDALPGRPAWPPCWIYLASYIHHMFSHLNAVFATTPLTARLIIAIYDVKSDIASYNGWLYDAKQKQQCRTRGDAM